MADTNPSLSGLVDTPATPPRPVPLRHPVTGVFQNARDAVHPHGQYGPRTGPLDIYVASLPRNNGQ